MLIRLILCHLVTVMGQIGLTKGPNLFSRQMRSGNGPFGPITNSSLDVLQKMVGPNGMKALCGPSVGKMSPGGSI